MSESKQAPKEFWIQQDDNQLLEVLRYKPFSSDYIRFQTFHVIEYKAYEAEKQKVKELVIQLKKVLNQANTLDNFRDPAVFVETDKLINKYGGSNE